MDMEPTQETASMEEDRAFAVTIEKRQGETRERLAVMRGEVERLSRIERACGAALDALEEAKKMENVKEKLSTVEQRVPSY